MSSGEFHLAHKYLLRGLIIYSFASVGDADKLESRYVSIIVLLGMSLNGSMPGSNQGTSY